MHRVLVSATVTFVDGQYVAAYRPLGIEFRAATEEAAREGAAAIYKSKRGTPDFDAQLWSLLRNPPSEWEHSEISEAEYEAKVAALV